MMCISKSLALVSMILLGVILLLSGCAPPAYSVPQSEQGTLFAPATRVVSPEPSNTAAPVQPQATPTIVCISNLKFIADVTVPDGMQVEGGSEVVKRWEVENTGSCDWDARFSLVNLEDSALGANPKQTLYPARSGTRAILQVIFTAPTEPGTYRSIWQAVGPEGEYFGDRFFVEFTVQ
jgi:hypothetical protein